MKNVLALYGSPREHSNSALLLDHFVTAFRENHPDCRIVGKKLQSMHINWCKSCNMCKRIGQGCVQKDDMAILYPLVTGADLIVLASPVYWWGISAQTKTFVDRLYALDTSCFAGKKLVLLITGADEETGIQYRLIQQQFKEICDYLKMNFVGYVAASADEDRPVSKHERILHTVRELAISV